MTDQEELNRDFVERLATVEAGQLRHEELIKRLDGTMGKIVRDVGQIRNAIVAMAVMLAANIPAIQRMVGVILKLLG